MTRTADRRDGSGGDVLVGEEFCHSSGRQRVDARLLQNLCGLMECREEIVGCELRVIRQNLLLRPTFGEQFEKKLDGEAGSLDDRFAHQDPRVNGDSLLPFHGTLPVRIPLSVLEAVRIYCIGCLVAGESGWIAPKIDN
jgi:hypothetical protein